MTHEETVEILATYALDAVEADEREAVERHLADCPRCRIELDALREVTTALGNSVEPLPEGLWSSIAARLDGRHDEVPRPMPRLVAGDDGDGDGDGDGAATTVGMRPSSSSRDGFRGRIAAIGAVVVAAAAIITVLGVSLVHADDQVSQLRNTTGGAAPSGVVSALEAPGHKVVDLEGAGHHMVAQFVVVPDGRGYLVSSSLPPLSDQHTYQLWGIVGGRPISLGLLGQSPDQAAFTLAGTEGASRLAITVEPAGGAVVPARSLVAQGTV
ncbi:MAG: anti-sigma factor domain-containing protein [Acidimicrobiales bacterium]